MVSFSMFDLFIMASGIYLVYTAVMMKKSGEIKNGIIVSKDIDINKIKDKQGFINYMYGKVLMIGALAVVVGGGSMLNTKLNGPAYLTLIGIILYLIVFVFYAIAFSKAKKMFIDSSE